MTDELDAPLGRPEKRRSNRLANWRKRLTMIACGLAALAAIATIYAPRDPLAGQPYAVARIERVAPAPAQPAAAPPGGPAEAGKTEEAKDNRDAAPANSQASIVSAIEERSGVKVTRSGGEGGQALIIQIDAPSARLAAAPDRRVTEKGAYGPLPKIGADGATPRIVYARPFAPPKGLDKAPRVALIVGGVGLDPASSAIDELPAGVTLALAPYGARIDAVAHAARERGHEILLQAPMEPFDYPATNPGPHTLLAGEHGAAALDDLRWLMSRFAGYAGVMNFLGARFMSDEAAFAPMLTELAQRGLFFIDDGTAPQSLAEPLARKIALPQARIDLQIDARPTPQAIDAALAELELIAKRKGSAIGFANATPATVTRLARYARELEKRGLALAPATAALGAGPYPAPLAQASPETRR